MSRNTFILLGLLTGSVAMIGCSKNITAPSVETDRQAQALSIPVSEDGLKEMEAEKEKFGGKNGRKLIRFEMENEAAAEGSGTSQAIPGGIGTDNQVEPPVYVKKAKWFENGAGASAAVPTQEELKKDLDAGAREKVKVYRKLRQAAMENDADGGTIPGVAPAPDQKDVQP